MGLSHSPKIATDGLVFAYDMGNTQKSWKGAPTTNLIDVAENLLDTKWTKEGGFGTVTANYGIAPNGTQTSTRLQYTNGYFYRRASTSPAITALTAGTTITFSCWVKGAAQPGRGIGLWSYAVSGIVAASTQAINPLTWTRVSVTYTIAAGATDFAINLAGAPSNIFQGDIEVWRPQLEVQTFVSPYVLGTRSNTQAVLDLTSTNILTANNLTYNVNGTFSFNNTTSVITMPDNPALNPTTALSIEAWVNFNGNSDDFIFEKGDVNSQYSLFSHSSDIVFRTFHSVDGTYHTQNPAKSTIGVVNGIPVHIICSWDGSTKRIYINGVLKDSVAKTGVLITRTTGAAIGRFGGTSTGYYFGGDIYKVAVYNKALSDSEVQQNFNALRGRYGV